VENGQGGETFFDTWAVVQLTLTEIYQENGEGDLEARGSAKGAIDLFMSPSRANGRRATKSPGLFGG
jgi:hypothetical protein